MSARLNAGELATKMFDYLCQRYPVFIVQSARWCMDKRLFDEPEISSYPDAENTFPSCIRAMEYVLEEGLPVWVVKDVKDGNNYPLDVFTYRKLEVLFDL